MTMIYTVVFEEIVFNETNVLGRKTFNALREEQLPFAPMPGLSISFSIAGLEMVGEYDVDEVLWDCVTRKFYCFSQRPLKDNDEVYAASESMEASGWTISKWEDDEEDHSEAVIGHDQWQRTMDIESCAAVIMAALQLKSYHVSLSYSALSRALHRAVCGLLAEIRPEGNTQPGESAIESLRHIYDLVAPGIKKDIMNEQL